MPTHDLDAFITKWAASGAAERAHKDFFLIELCDVLGVDRPSLMTGESDDDVYVFEKDVRMAAEGGSTSIGRIDLYKHDAFILEAKQGSSGGKKIGTAKRGTPSWEMAMRDAHGQALGYARTFDAPPPFLIVCDIGHCFDLYADFDGSRTYRPFPNAATNRIFFADLGGHVELFRAIWQDPRSLDPSKRSARVTREIAAHLADLARSLEASGHAPEGIARFLMRCLFTMFAEDTGMLPERLFTAALADHWIPSPASFPGGIESLWRAMNGGEHFGFVGKLLRFNGGMFSEVSALPLTKPQLELLHNAAKCEWSDVEPAIFGTLLERALSPKERHKLGAHFTPRAYVERLVKPTIEEPLRDEWNAVQAEARLLVAANKEKQARKVVDDFHRHLCSIRVLDPACGTGNFLYVTLDLFKRLEGEVLALSNALGEKQELLHQDGMRVTPAQFLGIEIKPWAKEIAELVLWIGYLQHHYKTFGKTQPPPEPVLQNFGNIECRDAILAYEEERLVLDEHGRPMTRWDGETTKKHPVTGEDVPDDTARKPVYEYVNARKAEWPKADFIVGNPPFLGASRMREMLGDGYASALRAAYGDLPESIDLVMYWWHKAAELVRGGDVRAFGLITTNTISQAFMRRVIQRHFDAKPPLRLTFAVPDHPWVDSVDGAAVRIAMTVGVLAEGTSALARVTREVARDDGSHDLELFVTHGAIAADLVVGASVSGAQTLRSNAQLASPGVKLHGAGFIVTEAEAMALGLNSCLGIERHLRKYRNGRDVQQVSRNVMVIDAFGLTEGELRQKFPAVYQHLDVHVRPARITSSSGTSDSVAYADKWWLFGKTRPELRKALADLPRYIATVETSKHRVQMFLDAEILPDNMLICIALSDAFFLGVLSSRVHVMWALASGGTLEDRPRYNKTLCFDPFPFPVCSDAQKSRIRDLAEQLDAHRKRQQAAHSDLTITGMYNVLEKLRSGEVLSVKEKVIHEQGLVSVLKQLHDELDVAVFDAYGWSSTMTDEELLEKLVALNAERAEEEKRGLIRWLRPEFQNPSGKGASTQATLDVEADADGDESDTAAPAVQSAPAWPKKLSERLAGVRSVINVRGRDWSTKDVARSFKNAKTADVDAVLESLAALGLVVAIGDEDSRRWRVAQ